MKQKIFSFGVLFLLFLVFNNYAKNDDWPVLKGPYLGQKPPGVTPEIFAPGIISTTAYSEACSVFSPNGKLFVFNRYFKNKPYTMFITEEKKGIWTKPIPAPFNSDYNDWDYDLSPDGRSIFFTSQRPDKIGDDPVKYGNIWMSKKTSSGWSPAKKLNFPINTKESHDAYPSVTIDGALYFFSNRRGGLGKSDIYRSRLENGEYKKVENLGSPVNSEFSDYDLYIAPDESYLIFSSTRPGSFSNDVDLYVTFKKRDGSWTNPKNMGKDINANAAVCPFVSFDGKYFFYHSGLKNQFGNKNIYWVNAKIIEDLKPKDLK
jgi:Tol biopolymer transport system component